MPPVASSNKFDGHDTLSNLPLIVSSVQEQVPSPDVELRRQLRELITIYREGDKGIQDPALMGKLEEIANAIETEEEEEIEAASAPVIYPSNFPTDEFTMNQSIAGMFIYVGCFIDNETRDFTVDQGETMDMTPAMCYGKCRGYNFFAVQYGGECRCGEDPPQLGEVPKDECFATCRGQSNLFCGGAWRNGVWKILAGSSQSAGEEMSWKPMDGLLHMAAQANAAARRMVRYRKAAAVGPEKLEEERRKDSVQDYPDLGVEMSVEEYLVAHKLPFLKIATFNLWNVNFPWPERMVRIATMINQLKPDVISFQEVRVFANGTSQLDQLLEFLADYDWVYERTAYLDQAREKAEQAEQQSLADRAVEQTSNNVLPDHAPGVILDNLNPVSEDYYQDEIDEDVEQVWASPSGPSSHLDSAESGNEDAIEAPLPHQSEDDNSNENNDATNQRRIKHKKQKKKKKQGNNEQEKKQNQDRKEKRLKLKKLLKEQQKQSELDAASSERKPRRSRSGRQLLALPPQAPTTPPQPVVEEGTAVLVLRRHKIVHVVNAHLPVSKKYHDDQNRRNVMMVTLKVSLDRSDKPSERNRNSNSKGNDYMYVEVFATHLSYADKQQCINALALRDWINANAHRASFYDTTNEDPSDHKRVFATERTERGVAVPQVVLGDMNTYFDFEWPIELLTRPLSDLHIDPLRYPCFLPHQEPPPVLTVKHRDTDFFREATRSGKVRNWIGNGAQYFTYRTAPLFVPTDHEIDAIRTDGQLFNDAWEVLHPDKRGFTFSNAEDMYNQWDDNPACRPDRILHRGARLRPCSAYTFPTPVQRAEFASFEFAGGTHEVSDHKGVLALYCVQDVLTADVEQSQGSSPWYWTSEDKNRWSIHGLRRRATAFSRQKQQKTHT